MECALVKKKRDLASLTPQYMQMPIFIMPINEKFELAGRKPDKPM